MPSIMREDINRPDVQQPNVPLQPQRPYQPWGQINDTHTDGKVNFNQLQLELNKRFSAGFLMQAEYSFTRSLDNVPLVGGVQNPYNRERRLRKHRCGAAPRSWWSITCTNCRSAAAGSSTSRTGSLDASRRGLVDLRASRCIAPARRFPSASPCLRVLSAGGVDGRTPWRAADLYAGQQSGHDIVIAACSGSIRRPSRRRSPGSGATRQRNSVYGPGFWNWDIGVQKTSRSPRSTACSFAATGLNAFNHFNLGNPNATIADTRDGGLPNPNAGKIFGGSGNRHHPVGLKYMF